MITVLKRRKQLKLMPVLVPFPQNEHWSDSVWKVCNISSVIILKYINRDLCIIEQRVLFLQDKSSELAPASSFTTMWLVEIISLANSLSPLQNGPITTSQDWWITQIMHA